MGMEFLRLVASANGTDLEEALAQWSIRLVGVGSLLVIMLILYASRQKRMKNNKKKTLFISITSLIVAVTVFLFGSTIYLNSISDSKGPVHWHADIEFWVCDAEVELRDPIGALSNKVGSATYHEHNDKRIHLEGVVVNQEYDASLGKFMDVTKGYIDETRLVLATEENYIEDDVDGDQPADGAQLKKYVKQINSGWVMELENGQMCGDQPAEVQLFVYRYNKENDTYAQEKIAVPQDYVIRDESVVPPGDCAIVEFAPRKDRTDRLCLQYGVRDKTRCAEFSGGERNDKLCTIYETTGGTQ